MAGIDKGHSKSLEKKKRMAINVERNLTRKKEQASKVSAHEHFLALVFLQSPQQMNLFKFRFLPIK